MNQTILPISLDYKPQKDNTVWHVNKLVEAMQINNPYLFVRDFKEYQAELVDDNSAPIAGACTANIGAKDSLIQAGNIL